MIWKQYLSHRLEIAEQQAPAIAQAQELLDAYAKFLERETLARPDQWYQFYDFFGQIDSPSVFNNRQPTTDTLTL